MPSETASTDIYRCIRVIVSVLVAVTISIGALPSAAGVMGAGVAWQPVQETAQLTCQAELPGGGAGSDCDAEETLPSNKSGCPMMGLCVNMSSGATHCGLVRLTDFSDLRPGAVAVLTIRYLRTEIQSTGLPGDPEFHPPIL